MLGQTRPQGSHFLPLDIDGDGKITKDEVLKMYALVDKDGDGSVTRKEFIQEILKAGKAKATSTEKKTPETKAPAGKPGDGHHGDGARGPGGPGGPMRGWAGRGGDAGPGRGRFGGFGFGGPGPHGPPTAGMLMERFDKDKNGALTKADVPEPVWNHISKADTNNDGSVSKEELEAFFKTHRPGQPPAGTQSKPEEKPAESKPEEKKPDDAKAQTQKPDVERPADATTATNVVLSTESSQNL